MGRPYQELADLQGPDYRSPAHGIPADSLCGNAPFSNRCAPELESLTRPGPGYSRDKALEMVRTRYERLPPLMRHTLPRLLADVRVRATFAELRSEGWKDWHLLTALANLIVNTRVAAKCGTPTWESADSYKDLFVTEMNRPEETDDPSVATDVVTRKALKDALDLSVMSTVHSWGLEIHLSSVDPGAVLKILGERYGYWTDDIDHEDFFLK
ncbi:hypothetical protein OHB01_08785 [Microbispora hainanensis]|uniref:hypothetical protein n=1 Tax=Microbispora hainanensis TaxID=568844 RepID=UPI002E2C4747|nr:hypothetical protein [Microbispora hainanensis]